MTKSQQPLQWIGLALIGLLAFQLFYPLQEGFKSKGGKTRSSSSTAGWLGGFFATSSNTLGEKIKTQVKEKSSDAVAEKAGEVVTNVAGSAVGSTLGSTLSRQTTFIVIGVVLVILIVLAFSFYLRA